MFQYPQYFPLPPNVTTQFPTRDSIANDKIVPVPIESSFFIEDARKDSARINRYYFDFPAEWITANNGESIVGIRSMWLVAKHRKLEFRLRIWKIDRAAYLALSSENKLEDEVLHISSSQEETLIKNHKLHKINLHIIEWFSPNDDFRCFFKTIHEHMKSYINKYKLNDYWMQSDELKFDRDIQADGVYDDNGYHEIIYSERNNVKDSSVEPNLIFFKIIDVNEDFREVFNVGTGPTENNIEKYMMTPHRKLVFNNIWDRHSCKIYSSIAEQSLHHYIGNSEVNFVPIKYYKLQSSDQRFWIEFHSGWHYNVPVKLPKNVSFVIDMQFLPYNKLLYV